MEGNRSSASETSISTTSLDPGGGDVEARLEGTMAERYAVMKVSVEPCGGCIMTDKSGYATKLERQMKIVIKRLRK